MKKNKLMKLVVSGMAAFLFVSASPRFGNTNIIHPQAVQAAKGDQGPDWAKYQGYTGKFGYASDKFALAQLGGTYGGTLIDQLTYSSQVKSGKNNGLRMHTYLWYGVGGNSQLGQFALDYYLPKVATPKGSIVALDYEDGASGDVTANTNAVLYGMRRVASKGYTPMLYSGKSYVVAHLNYQKILTEFPNSLWLAEYPNYLVTTKPNYAYFPSLPGVAIFQFTSTYVAGGLDGNIDLTGITDNGYSKQPSKPAVTAPSKPTTTVSNQDYAQNGVFKFNTTVNVRNGASTTAGIVTNYDAGQTVIYNHVFIINGKVWARYNSYNGSTRYFCMGLIPGVSYGERSTATVSRTYTVKYGDSFWSIANKLGVNMYSLAAKNGKSINSIIYPGQNLTY